MLKKLIGWLNALRKKGFRILSGGKIISAISHFVLVLAGTLAPAYLAYAGLGKMFAIITFFVVSEIWVLFMTGREVLDYTKHKARGDDIDETWQDGLGDLVGPYFVHGAGWAGILWLIFGG